MASYSLDDIRAAAERKYGSTDIEVGGETIRLLNPLRLPKARRDELLALQEQMGKDDSDQAELLSEAIRTVAQSEKAADNLLDEVGGDLAILAEIFRHYGESTQAGEASASQA
ncbi:phage tail assembly protein [Streptomyces prunicolor]|uniref:phage tail assembly protein n=1 Tax=Streptomyces TaxID=1883 RepID=UPI0022504F1A|nr:MULTISPECIES: phage tail assembly protein [Streptomyces]MCX5237222.1 phage tail assembly protein [Streptomyces prunicolor]WSP73857.1 phage tail assembly protein [Streptomyces sp. NBC_01236]